MEASWRVLALLAMCSGASAFLPSAFVPIATPLLAPRQTPFRLAFSLSPELSKRHVVPGHTTALLSPGLAETLFKIDNVAVLPFWLLMILIPKSAVTVRVMGSHLAFVPLALVYAFLVISSITAPGGLDIFTSGAGITLATLSRAFADPSTMAAGWAHYVCFDLFVGRWMWADGLRNKVFTSHSLFLGLLFGPLGLLTHLVTRALFAGSGSPKDPLVDGLDDPMSDENLYSLIEDRR